MHSVARRAICASLLLLPATRVLAQAGGWPERPVRLLVGFPPGNATDLAARVIAEPLSRRLGQPVLVENRPGQGGSVAMAALAKAPADGYTLMLSATASALTNPYLYKSVGYDTLKDFAPIGVVAEFPMLLVANPGAPFSNVREFVAHAKANPGKLNYSSSGNGTLSHLAMELLKRRTGLDLVHVPYQGSVRAMTDLIAGSVTVGFDTITATQAHLETRRLKALGASSERRLAGFAEVPTVAESGLEGFAVVPWLGLFAPRGTPAAIIERIDAEMRRIVQDPAADKSLRLLGGLPRSTGPEEFARQIARDAPEWARIVRESGATVD